MFNLLGKKEELALLVDIGNGSVGTALTLFQKGNKPKVEFSLRSPFTISKKPGSGKLISQMNTLLDQTLSLLMRNGSVLIAKNKITSALVTFSSPWIASKTKHIEISLGTSFNISEKFLNDIIKKEENVFKKELAPNPLNVIEKVLINTKVNGYPVNEIIGKKAKDFDCLLFMSLLPENILKIVQDLIFKQAHLLSQNVLIHGFPLVSFSLFRDIFPDDSDFIIMDITSEVTDMTLVLDDAIFETISFPYGKNSILREIANNFEVTPSIAESMLHMWMSNKADDSVSKKMKGIFENIEKSWSEHFDSAWRKLSIETLPSRIFLTADNDIVQTFKELIDLPNLTYINEDILSPLYKNNSLSPDEFMAILSIFYNKKLARQ